MELLECPLLKLLLGMNTSKEINEVFKKFFLLYTETYFLNLQGLKIV